MSLLPVIEPIVDLLKDEVVQEKVGEVARFFYMNDSVTINLYYAAAAVLLGFLLLIPLLALFFQPSAGATGGGYGAPAVSYGAPEPSYGAPEPAYGAPGHSYSRSDDIYGEARSLYNEISDASAEPSDVVYDITKKFGSVGPVMSALGTAAAKLLE